MLLQRRDLASVENKQGVDRMSVCRNNRLTGPSATVRVDVEQMALHIESRPAISNKGWLLIGILAVMDNSR